jgi:DNA-binding CsgD family transcriptional regulator/PAS domain-containing protein
MERKSAHNAPHILELVTRLYESLTSDEPWQRFLVSLREVLSAQYATIIIARVPGGPPEMIASPDSDRAHMIEYCKGMFRIDSFRGIPAGQALTMSEHLGSGLEKSEFYNGYLRPVGVSHLLGLDVQTESGLEARLRITRMVGNPPFSEPERHICEDLTEHLRQALGIFDRLSKSTSAFSIYTDFIDGNPMGIVVVDCDLNLVSLNLAAKRLLAERDGIHERGDKLAFDDGALSRSLRGIFDRPEGKTTRVSAFQVRRPSGRPNLGLSVRFLDDRSTQNVVASSRVMLCIGDPVGEINISEEILRGLFGFTASEATVAAIVANGLSVQDAAERLGVSITTVRAHIRAIFSKTGVSRQSELVHLIYMTVPSSSVYPARH